MGNQQSLPPENDLPSLEERWKHHAILKEYRVDSPLERGSGRFMKTFRIKHNVQNVTAVLKTGWVCVHDESAAATAAAAGGSGDPSTLSVTGTTTTTLKVLTTQRAELQRLRDILKPQTHIAPFVAWYSSEQDDRGGSAQQQHQQSYMFHTKGHHTTATTTTNASASSAAAAAASVSSATLSWQPFYLLRPHFYTTLQDRLQSRPFLQNAEKVFLASQLLQAVSALHQAGVVHGFITSSNVALTATNWLVLTDLAAVVKQNAVLAQDDPSDFLYYFCPVQAKGGSRANTNKQCYLAPERFVDKRSHAAMKHVTTNNATVTTATAVSSTEGTSTTPAAIDSAAGHKRQDILPSATTESSLTPAMDIFSVGCVLTEVFLNGEPCLELGDLLEYKARGSLTPTLQQKLHKIERSAVRAACKHMLQLDPQQRLSAAAYWERWMETEECFPHEILTQLVEKVTTQTITPDARLALAAQAYGQVLWECVGVRDEQGQAYFDRVLGFPSQEETTATRGDSIRSNGETAETDLLSLSDDTQSLLQETEALLAQLDSLQLDEGILPKDTKEATTSCESKSQGAPLVPETTDRTALSKSSLLIFLQVVAATVPHVQRPASKLVSLQLLKRLAKYSSNEARLQRIVPVAVSLLQDQDVLVKASAIQVLSYTLSIVESFSPSDSQIFPQYIFKRVSHLISDPSLVVRLAFARCIAKLAETAQRFLDITHAVRLYEAVGSTGSGTKSADNAGQGGEDTAVFGDNIHKLLDTESRNSSKLSLAEQTEASMESTKSEVSSVLSGRTLISSTYKVELSQLQETVSRWVVQLTTDQSNHASFSKRAVLQDLGRLCAFFGLDGVMAYILPQILAFLNERRDWELRADLFKQMPCVCHVIGRAATEEYVLPCVEIGLVDCEEQVVSQALQCLAELVRMGLLSRFALVGSTLNSETVPISSLLSKYGVLLLHPSENIRNSATFAFSAMSELLGPLDTEVYAFPQLSPFFKFKPSSHSMATAPGLQQSLVLPWSRERFSQELTLIAASVQGTHQTPGAWTSIDISLAEANTAIEASPSPAHKDTIVSTIKTDPRAQRFRDYLVMFVKHTASFPLQERATLGPALSTGIEGSVKLAQNVMFPRQNGRDQQGIIPAWFDSLRYDAKSNNLIVSADTAIRSVSSLGQVYGLSIMGPAGRVIDGVVDTADEAGEGTETSTDVMRTNEALNIEAAIAGRWGSETTLDPEAVDTCLLVTKLKSMRVPPLPPQLGSETTTRRPPPGRDPSSAKNWKPKMNAMVATSLTATGHTAPVVRLAVSMDQKFFISGSHDGTCRIWDIPHIDDCNGILESSATYSGHSTGQLARINDIAMLEGSHSVVSGASDGSVHVWRVDLNVSSKTSSQLDSVTKVGGTTSVQRLIPGEGEVLAVSHFNTPCSSVITYATQKGCVHSWDLRCAQEPFALMHDPSLGNLSALALGSDRNWLVTGTSNGFVTLWDIRFLQPVKLWKHNRSSAISRLATSYVFSPQHSGDMSGGARPFIFVASGSNECGMFDVLTGRCQECFRVAEGDSRNLNTQITDPPALKPVHIDSYRNGGTVKPLKPPSLPPRVYAFNSFNCMIGSVGAGEHSYLLTGGSDSSIRFWDFSVPSKCFIVSGSQQGQPRPGYERIDFDGSCRLMLCRESLLGLRDTNALQKGQFRGLKKPEHYHKDSVEDLKIIDNNSLLSCSRDCTVKVWR